MADVGVDAGLSADGHGLAHGVEDEVPLGAHVGRVEAADTARRPPATAATSSVVAYMSGT